MPWINQGMLFIQKVFETTVQNPENWSDPSSSFFKKNHFNAKFYLIFMTRFLKNNWLIFKILHLSYFTL